MTQLIQVTRAYGTPVSGEVIVFREGFSPRYDLDRVTGIISRRGHSAEGQSLKDKIVVIPTAKGGVAGGWAFADMVYKGFAPKALVFGKLNPVMAQGAIFAKLTITEGWSPDALAFLRTGDGVEVDPQRRMITRIATVE
jgi:predicted aconitase with swiveling domain